MISPFGPIIRVPGGTSFLTLSGGADSSHLSNSLPSGVTKRNQRLDSCGGCIRTGSLCLLTLESRGAVIRLASSAAEALDSISRDKPDLMIADIGMPQEDGYVLIDRLRTLEREHSLGGLSAIALTAYASDADRDQALAAGYDLQISAIEQRKIGGRTSPLQISETRR